MEEGYQDCLYISGLWTEWMVAPLVGIGSTEKESCCREDHKFGFRHTDFEWSSKVKMPSRQGNVWTW